jgi:predicted exporter
LRRDAVKHETRSAGRLWLAGWTLVAALMGAYVWDTLKLSGDLRLFLPKPKTAEQHLLLEGIGEGPASSLLLIALDGAPLEELVAVSRDLVSEIRGQRAFLRIDNGDTGLDAVPERLLPYRYLLSPGMDGRRFDAPTLHRELEARVRDLMSPAAPVLEPIMTRDPTFELLRLAESWMPLHEPERVDGVWFDSARGRALLVAQTHAAAFDPDGQQAALDVLAAAFERARGTSRVKMLVSGPGSFSALMKDHTQAEAQWLGTAATVGMLLLIAVAYRRVRVLWLGTLPLASAGFVGLACVSYLFGEVHGITLAFGFTLIGVAQDYPMHLFSHQRAGVDPVHGARELWPTMATGVASTCIAYLAFLASGVNGLAQLAVFTISGLAVAGLTTRYIMPRIIGDDYPDNGVSQRLAGTWRILAGLPVPRWLPVALVTACALALAMPGPMWEDDLGGLTPIPRELLQRDAELRTELGAPDVRYLLGLRAPTADEALQRLEALAPTLSQAVAAGTLDGFDDAARYLPSIETQRRRQAELPDSDTLRAALREAQAGLPFRPGAFEPFVADVTAARELAPLTLAGLDGTPLSALAGSLLSQRGDEWIGIVTLTGVHDPDALDLAVRQAGTGVILVDLKRASTSLVIEQRTRILWTLAMAAVLLVAVVRIALGDWRRAIRVLAPMALTTLIVVAALHAGGQPMNLFHLIALVLAAGLGLDYALFFERAADDPKEQRRTLHGVLVCSISTLMVFALLAFSSIPVLRAIGVTVSLGVVSNFLLALLMTRPPAGSAVARA